MSQGTNSANDISILAGLGVIEKLSDSYKEVEGSRYSPIDPEIHLNCVEQVRSWINKQEVIHGAVMNITDREILHNLSNRKRVHLVVNYDSSWMTPQCRYGGGHEDRFRLYDAINSLGNSSLESGAASEKIPYTDDGVSVFYNWKEGGKYADLMHHKFMIGWEKDGDGLSASLMYGSFNMSFSSPQYLDSVMIFRQNLRLVHWFNYLFSKVMLGSTPWGLLSNIGLDKCLAMKKYFMALSKEEQEDWNKRAFDGSRESFFDWLREFHPDFTRI